MNNATYYIDVVFAQELELDNAFEHKITKYQIIAGREHIIPIVIRHNALIYGRSQTLINKFIPEVT